MKNKKQRKPVNENFKIKISESDIKHFPIDKMEIDEFWSSLYKGAK